MNDMKNFNFIPAPLNLPELPSPPSMDGKSPNAKIGNSFATTKDVTDENERDYMRKSSRQLKGKKRKLQHWQETNE